MRPALFELLRKLALAKPIKHSLEYAVREGDENVWRADDGHGFTRAQNEPRGSIHVFPKTHHIFRVSNLAFFSL